jgi:hypothetical protein
MSDLFCCVACGTQGEAKCNCSKGYGFMPANEAAAKGVAAHPNWSDSRIAQAVGVSDKTIAKARRESTSENSEVDRNATRVGKDGRKRKSKRRKNPQDKERQAASLVLDKGMSYEQAAAEAGIDGSVQVMKVAVAREEGRRKGEADPEITPDMLSKSAQEKLASAMRQYQKKLDAQLVPRVQAEIKRLVEAMVLPAFKQEREDHALMVKYRKGPFKTTEYNVLLRCVHPDRTPTIAEKTEAIQLLIERKLLLLSDKEDPRMYPKIPTADEIIRGRKS